MAIPQSPINPKPIRAAVKGPHPAAATPIKPTPAYRPQQGPPKPQGLTRPDVPKVTQTAVRTGRVQANRQMKPAPARPVQNKAPAALPSRRPPKIQSWGSLMR